MNRQSLVLSIMAWLHRASLRTPVANEFDASAGFIALCEQDLNERLRARCMILRTQQEIDGQYTTLPCDYLELFDLRLAGGGPPLSYVTRETAANAYWQYTSNSPGNAGDSIGALPPDFYPIVNQPAYPWGDGTPRRYSIVGNEIEWTPFPIPPANIDGTQPPAFPVAEMAYYARQQLAMANDATNAVLATYPAIYIYGSLIHSAPFLRDDSRVATWQKLYDGAIAGANAEHERARTQGSPLRQTYRRLA
jgi:hypothetical protein